MISRLNKLITLGIIVGLAIYVVVLNNHPTTFFFSRGNPTTSNTGVLVIISFVIGFFVATAFGIYFSAKAYFRERRLEGREKQRINFYDSMLNARALLASEEWGKATQLWEQLVRRDPTDIIARIELSKCLEGRDQLNEALKVIDAARSAAPQNIEVLFRAAELNLLLENKTAAIDNLALILSEHPNKRAGLLARTLSESLGRIDDALEYDSQLVELSGDNSHYTTSTRLQLKKLLRDLSGDKNELYTELRTFAKKHPTSIAALERLSELELEEGNIENAAQNLIRAAKISGSEELWGKAVTLWLSNNLPDRALAAARSATKETSGEERLEAELNLLYVYIRLGMLEEARTAIEGFKGIAASEKVEISEEIKEKFAILRAHAFARLNEIDRVLEALRDLSDIDVESVLVRRARPRYTDSAPAPRLSTP